MKNTPQIFIYKAKCGLPCYTRYQLQIDFVYVWQLAFLSIKISYERLFAVLLPETVLAATISFDSHGTYADQLSNNSPSFTVRLGNFLGKEAEMNQKKLKSFLFSDTYWPQVKTGGKSRSKSSFQLMDNFRFPFGIN